MRATLEAINRMQTDRVIGKYAIGGAVGATFYLEPAATLDIDILAELRHVSSGSLLTLAPIFEYLTARGYNTEHEHIVIEGWPVQFLAPASALEEEALEQARETDVEGVPTRVITAEHLVAISLRTGRPKDFARILQFVESGVLNADNLDSILSRHALLEKWDRFGDRFLRGSE